jgi:hypothetical protein
MTLPKMLDCRVSPDSYQIDPRVAEALQIVNRIKPDERDLWLALVANVAPEAIFIVARSLRFTAPSSDENTSL